MRRWAAHSTNAWSTAPASLVPISTGSRPSATKLASRLSCRRSFRSQDARASRAGDVDVEHRGRPAGRRTERRPSRRAGSSAPTSDPGRRPARPPSAGRRRSSQADAGTSGAEEIGDDEDERARRELAPETGEELEAADDAVVRRVEPPPRRSGGPRSASSPLGRSARARRAVPRARRPRRGPGRRPRRCEPRRVSDDQLDRPTAPPRASRATGTAAGRAPSTGADRRARRRAAPPRRSARARRTRRALVRSRAARWPASRSSRSGRPERTAREPATSEPWPRRRLGVPPSGKPGDAVPRDEREDGSSPGRHVDYCVVAPARPGARRRVAVLCPVGARRRHELEAPRPGSDGTSRRGVSALGLGDDTSA